MQTTTLRPGILVSLKTAIRGNISYTRRDIEPETLKEDGSTHACWETERSIFDPAELKAATKVRDKARSLVTSVCIKSPFGPLCPEKAEDALDRAIAEAERLADEFNAAAKLTSVDIFPLKGRIAADDVQAAKAINSEVRDLLARMDEGIRKLDVKMVRDAANRAGNLGRMLTPDAQASIKGVVDAVRSEASRIKKAGEQVALEIDQATLRRIAEARTAFLDLEPAGEVATPAAEARAIDLEPMPDIKAVPTPRPALALE